MSVPKTPRSKSRAWVALFTSLLNDTDLILAGQDARGLYPYLLLHSAEQGLDGYLPASPRAIQLFAHLDGGLKAVEAAIATLVDIDKLEHRDGQLYIRTWDRYQADFGGSETRSKSMVLAQHKRGNHKEPREGCELCETATSAPAAVDEPQQATTATSEAAEVKEKVRIRCDQVITMAEAEGADLLEAYAGLYEFVTEQAPRFAHVKGIGEATLLNIVVDHAAQHYLGNGKPLTAGTLSKVHGIRGRHGIDVLTKLDQAADKDKPTGYFFACYRDEQKAAA